MNEIVSKGITALRRSNQRAERVTVGGETFFFKKLTIEMEEELDKIVKERQDLSLKLPERPEETAGEEVFREYTDAVIEYKQKSAKAFRVLTAEIMKYILLDESDKPLFAPEDDVYSLLNNVYAENFSKAYMQFRFGAEASAAQAEARFQK